MNADYLLCFLSAFIRFHWGHPLDSRWKDYEMRKRFTRKPQGDEPATRGKNYITRSGRPHRRKKTASLRMTSYPGSTTNPPQPSPWASFATPLGAQARPMMSRSFAPESEPPSPSP